MDPDDCKAGSKRIKETQLKLLEETPLVGFHAMIDPFGITSLGLILVDTLDPLCQHPLDIYDATIYKGMDEWQESIAAEESITEDEKMRADALESIILYDSMIKARWSKEEIYDQIKALEDWSPITFHDPKDPKPSSVEDLSAILDNLAEYDYEQNKPETKGELKVILN